MESDPFQELEDCIEKLTEMPSLEILNQAIVILANATKLYLKSELEDGSYGKFLHVKKRYHQFLIQIKDKGYIVNDKDLAISTNYIENPRRLVWEIATGRAPMLPRDYPLALNGLEEEGYPYRQ